MRVEQELAELCTAAVRRTMPRCEQKRLRLLYDYVGPCVAYEGDPEALMQAMGRLFDAAIDILQDGFVFFTARAEAQAGPGCAFTVVAASTGRFAQAPVWRSVLQRLQLQGVQSMSDEVLMTTEVPVRGVCPLTGAAVQFSIDPVEGSLFSLQAWLPAARSRPHAAVHAGQARVWVVAEAGACTQGVERRLQRMGWHVRTFESIEEAAREAETMPSAWRRPALVLGFETRAVTLERLRWLWALLPPSTDVVLAVHPNSPTLQMQGQTGAVQVRPGPFSPAELAQLTGRAAREPQAPSGMTQPAPLGFEQRRRALVVDDNEVNLMVASGMLQVLGFEVETAADGLEAIDRCLHGAPDLVLMDLHMPGMDGLEATRRLRLLQHEGAIPHFPIIAATADTTAQQACVQAGMDAHLPKPLNLAGLETQLRRLMPAMS